VTARIFVLIVLDYVVCFYLVFWWGWSPLWLFMLWLVAGVLFAFKSEIDEWWRGSRDGYSDNS
jgi:fatty acid desaturase